MPLCLVKFRKGNFIIFGRMIRKEIYTESLGRLVASRARPSDGVKYHVILGDSKWLVVLEGSIRALRAFTNFDHAVDYAKETAQGKTGEVVVHEKNGLIRDRFSFAAVK